MDTYWLNPNLGQLPAMVSGRQPVLAEHRHFRRCLLYAGDQRIIHILTGGVGTDAQAVRVGLKDRGAGNSDRGRVSGFLSDSGLIKQSIFSASGCSMAMMGFLI